MPFLYLDLETVGTNDPAVIAEIASTITPPGNYKKPETIAAWEQGEKKRAVEEAVARTCFTGEHGKIICIGYARDDFEVMSLEVDRPWYQEPDAFQEHDLLHSFFTELRSYSELTFVGHNIGWDLRMLYQRACVLSIKPPPVLLNAMRAKPWDGTVIDTLRLWDSDPSKKISLDKLCKVLGIVSPKGDMDGSMVAQLYRDGRIQEISEYCKRDTLAVRECYRRLTFQTATGG